MFTGGLRADADHTHPKPIRFRISTTARNYIPPAEYMNKQMFGDPTDPYVMLQELGSGTFATVHKTVKLRD